MNQLAAALTVALTAAPRNSRIRRFEREARRTRLSPAVVQTATGLRGPSFKESSYNK